MEFSTKENSNTSRIREKTLSDLINKSRLYFLGVRVDNIDRDTALAAIKNFLYFRNNNIPKKVFFTNVHTIHLARSSQDFREKVNNADLVLADGSGLSIAGKILSRPIKENLNGTDLTPIVLHEAEKEGWSVYLLGAKDSVLEKCIQNLQIKFPNLKIAGYNDGFFTKEETPALIERINRVKPDILLVAMGSPIQELFIGNNAQSLSAVVCFAVGGLFDFLSGDKKRAPLWVRKIGMEWVFRFFLDPKAKWNRIFLEIPAFLFIIVVQRIASFISPITRIIFPKSKTGDVLINDK